MRRTAISGDIVGQQAVVESFLATSRIALGGAAQLPCVALSAAREPSREMAAGGGVLAAFLFLTSKKVSQPIPERTSVYANCLQANDAQNKREVALLMSQQRSDVVGKGRSSRIDAGS